LLTILKIFFNNLNLKTNKPITFCLDTFARAMYITFSNKPVTKTVRKDSSFSIDYDKDGNLVGIEIIRLRRVSAVIQKLLKDAETIIPSQVRKTVEDLIHSLT
jgi:uncharacterized protein YuzE